MKLLQSTLPFVVLAAALTSSLWPTQAKNDPGGSKWHKVLIIDGQNNHKWQATTPIIKHALVLQAGFRVEVSTYSSKEISADSFPAYYKTTTAFQIAARPFLLRRPANFRSFVPGAQVLQWLDCCFL